MDNDSRIRFSIAQLFVLIGCISGILAVGRYHPGLAVLSSIIFAGWMMRRYGHGHFGGIIPSMLGLFILAAHAFDRIESAREPFFLDFTKEIGTLMTVVGILVFCCVAAVGRSFWRSQLFLAGCVSVILIGCWTFVPKVSNTNLIQRRANDVAINNAAMAKSVEQIESLRKRIGRVPDESELIELLDEPLPCFQWDGYRGQISYHRFANNQYRLSFCLNWEIYNYDSSTPQRGWYREPF